MMAALPEVDRRRLLEVRGLHPAVPVLVLHPLLTVVTGLGREASDTVVECLGRLGAPLGPTVTGTAEIGGRVVELPGALADPDTRPEVVRNPMILGELVRRRAADAAADLSQRAAHVSRFEAALARRDQLVDRLDRLSSRAQVLEQQLHPAAAIDDEIERLLAAACARELTEPNPIIIALLDEWDALVAERKASASGPTAERAEANLDAMRARIAERRLATAGGNDSEVLDAEGVAQVQKLHAVLEELASSLDGVRRSDRRAAGREIVAALEGEHEALVNLGFDSYAAFLLAMAEGRAEDDPVHDAAALQAAEAALERARERERAFVVLSERELDLRTRVARLLGRLPGPDVGSELRSGRDELPPSGALDRLEAALRSTGMPVGDPIEAAQRWLAGADSRRAQRAALGAELAEIESEGCRLDEQLEQAEAEVAAAERELTGGVDESLAGTEARVMVGSIAAAELAATLVALVAPEGPPVVVGECFAELSPQGCAALLEVLGETSRRRQVIIVTEHEDVAMWAQGLGLAGVVWTPAAAAEQAPRASLDQGVARDTATPVEQPDVVPADGAHVAVDIVDAADIAEIVEIAEVAYIGEPPEPQKGLVAREPVEARESELVPPPPAVPEPSQAAGPRKSRRRGGRKSEAVPAAEPWEGRFDTDTARRRALPNGAERPSVPPTGSEPLALCVAHRGVVTRNRCARCAQPACDECLVTPRGRRKAICIECAIIESGVRKHRRSGG